MNSALNVARLIAECNKIDGRKKLQKIVHILQCCGHRSDFPHQFGYLHYGPYSHEVKADLDSLTSYSAMLVNEVEGSVPGLGHRSFEYSASPRLKEAFAKSSPPEWRDMAQQLNRRPAQDLEAISTVLFLTHSGVSGPDLKNRFLQLKPALSSRFDDAMEFVSRI